MAPITRFCLLLAAFAGVAQAHFTLDSPQTRGMDEDKEPTAPCGGFDTISNPRQNFPISGGVIKLTSEHTTASTKFFFVSGAAPAAADFTNSSLSHSAAADLAITKAGPTQSATVNLSSFAKVGDVGTIQLIFNGGDGNLFQCSDVMLTAAVTPAPATGTSAAGRGMVASAGAAIVAGAVAVVALL
ncbi:hypothetical protein HDU87_005836 [Geranomyces variabilis]|uniref:Copper acquisition factor BIM1-like domain-containing protein n=1 Tax=Geranomyces variabilis TaxID=109894 RepID=A0AAD5TGJ4_9FUNG|nr:hypothetical protein HDU87_005836 [Geranomyces variabilis]